MHSSLAGSDAVPWLGATNSCPNAIGRQVVADDGTGWRGLSTSTALTSTQHLEFLGSVALASQLQQKRRVCHGGNVVVPGAPLLRVLADRIGSARTTTLLWLVGYCFSGLDLNPAASVAHWAPSRE